MDVPATMPVVWRTMGESGEEHGVDDLAANGLGHTPERKAPLQRRLRCCLQGVWAMMLLWSSWTRDR